MDRNMQGPEPPMKIIKIMDNKVYKGEQIAVSHNLTKLLSRYEYSAPNLRRFKRSNMKRKNIIYENDLIQIGCISDLIFEYINKQNYLKLTIFIGNKTKKAFRNIKIGFDGDQSCYVYQKGEKDITFLAAQTQEQLEIVVGHKDVPYQIVNLDLHAEVGDIEDSEDLSVIAFLPHLLPKYLFFKDLDAYVFKSTWKQLRHLAQRTDIFNISPHIIKTPAYFKRFFTKILELTSLEAFVSQSSNLNDDIKYYKLGAFVELCDSESDFLLKLNIRPDYTMCIQIISINQANRTTAENVLQHLRFLLQS